MLVTLTNTCRSEVLALRGAKPVPASKKLRVWGKQQGFLLWVLIQMGVILIISKVITDSSNSFRIKPHISFKFLVTSGGQAPWKGNGIWVQAGCQSWSAGLDCFLGPSKPTRLIYKVGIAAVSSQGYWED